MSAANRLLSLSTIAAAALALAACGGGGGDSGGSGGTSTAPTDAVPAETGAGITAQSSVVLPAGQEQDKIELEATMVSQVQEKTAVAEALIAAAKTTTCADAGTTGTSMGGPYSNCVVAGGKYRLQSEAAGGATRTAGAGTAYSVTFKQMTIDLAWPTDQGLGMPATASLTGFGEATASCTGGATNVCTLAIAGTGFTWGNDASYVHATKASTGTVQYYGTAIGGGNAYINFALQGLTNNSGTAFVFFSSTYAIYKRLSTTTYDVWYERDGTAPSGDGFWLRNIVAK